MLLKKNFLNNIKLETLISNLDNIFVNDYTLHASQVTAPQCHPLEGSPQTLHGSKRSSLTNNPMLASSAILNVVLLYKVTYQSAYFFFYFSN
jgi:hypothetical protein